MPLIPLPTNNRPLANAPAAVLNREKAPTVNNAGVMAGIGQLAKAGQQPEISGRAADALTAPDRALGAIGGAIAQAGGVLGALAIKRREAESDVQIAQADAEMQAESAKFDQWKIETNADPATWDAEWQKRLGGLQNRITAKPELHEGAREAIGLRLTRFAGQSQASVAAGAARETFARAKSAFIAGIEQRIQGQDEPGFTETLKTAEDKGYLFPHEAQAYREKYTSEGRRIKRQAEADAFETAQDDVTTFASGHGESETLKALDDGFFGSYAAADKERLRSIAKQVSGARSAEAVDILVNGIASGEVTSAARIEEMAAENPHLPKRLVAELKDRIGSYSALNERLKRDEKDKDGVSNGVREAVRLRHEIASYNPTTDPDRLKYAQLAQEIATKADANMAGELRSDLGQKYGLTTKGELRPEAQRQISKTLSVIFDSDHGIMPWRRQEPKTFKRAADDRPFFGKPQFRAGDTVMETDPATGQPRPKVVVDSTGNVEMQWVEDLKAKEAAVNAEALIEEKMRQWAALNPEKATNTVEINKALRSFIPTGSRAGLFLQQQQRRDEANGGPLPTGRRETLDTSLFP